MALEIKELHIRITVDNQAAQSGNPVANPSGGGMANAPSGGPDPALIDLCVEKVLEVLARKMER